MDETHRATIGVDVGGTKMLAVLLDAGGVVRAEAKVATPAEGAQLLHELTALIRRLLADQQRRGLDVIAVGVGVPGLVDTAGILQFAPNLPRIVGLEVKAGLAAHFPGLPLLVGNDASCAGWAERITGAAKGSDDALMVTLGTGIGGGLIAGGRLIGGANGFAGEIGHMVVNPHGPPCPCGKRGCWERYASGSGLGRLAREAAIGGQATAIVALAGGDPEAVRGEHVTRACAAGDREAMQVMADFAWWLALGLANLANVFDPSCIVLGGGLIESGDVLMVPAREAFADLVEAVEHRPRIDIVPAALGERAGAIGAGLLAAQESGNGAGAAPVPSRHGNVEDPGGGVR